MSRIATKSDGRKWKQFLHKQTADCIDWVEEAYANGNAPDL